MYAGARKKHRFGVALEVVCLINTCIGLAVLNGERCLRILWYPGIATAVQSIGKILGSGTSTDMSERNLAHALQVYSLRMITASCNTTNHVRCRCADRGTSHKNPQQRGNQELHSIRPRRSKPSAHRLENSIAFADLEAWLTGLFLQPRKA